MPVVNLNYGHAFTASPSYYVMHVVDGLHMSVMPFKSVITTSYLRGCVLLARSTEILDLSLLSQRTGLATLLKFCSLAPYITPNHLNLCVCPTSLQLIRAYHVTTTAILFYFDKTNQISTHMRLS